VAKEIWGLDLGEWSLKAARGRADKKGGTIVLNLYDEIRYDTLNLTEGATDLDKMRAALAAFGSKHQLAKGADLLVAVSGSEVFSRFINLPPVPESISEIIHYEARQQIPFDISEVVWDYQPLKEEHQPGEEIEVGLFALKRDRVDEIMELLAPWRRHLRAIQDAPLALYNLLRYEGRGTEPTIVLDMGASTTDLLVLNHPRFWLRPLLVGGNNITERLQSHFGISYQESERIKERVAESAREAQLLRVIRPVVGNILSEIQRSLGYYKSMARGVKFTKILALGNAFKLRGLDKAIAEGLQYPVETLNDLRGFEFAMPLRKAEFLPRLIGAGPVLGLLVQGAGMAHIRINLVPEELARAAVMARKKPLVAAAAAGLLVMAGIFVAAERAQGEDLAKRMHAGETVYELVRAREREFDAARKAAEAQEGKLKRLVDRDVERDILLRVVPEVVQALPPPVYVKEMRLAWVDSLTLERVGRGETFEPRQEGVGRLPGPGGASGVGLPGEGMGFPATPGGVPVPSMPGQTPAGGSARWARPGRREARDVTRRRTARRPMALALTLDCESTQIEQGLSYIESEVIEVLKNERRPVDEKQIYVPIFKDVQLVGGLQDVYRRASDGVRVERGAEGDEVIQFVAFRLVAEINLEED